MISFDKNEIMKTPTYLFFVIGLLSFTNCKSDAQRTFSKFQYQGKDYEYAVQLPNNYDASKTYPVLIGPSDVRGDDEQSFYWRDAKYTKGWILIDYPIYGALKRTDNIKALLEHLKSVYKVENNKFHTVCFSANSAGIFDLVMAMPEFFAGITGMAGNPGTQDKNRLKKLKGVKVQFVVGDQDTYWMRSAKNRHQLLLDIGVDSSIEIIKNGKHVLSGLIGDGFLERAHRLR